MDFGILLGLAYQNFVQELRQQLTAEGFGDLGRSDGYVFRAISPHPITVSELAGQLEISKQGAAQLVESMEQRGYVSRRPDPADGRARLLYLTDRGTRALTAARRFHQQFEQRLIDQHGHAAIALLRARLAEVAGDTAGVGRTLRAFYL